MSLSQRYLLALGAAALAMPIFVLGFGLPALAGFVGSLAIFCALALFAAVRPGGAAKRAAPKLNGLRDKPARAALADAMPAIEAIEAVWTALPKGAVRDRLFRIHAEASRIADTVARDPTLLPPAQRVLTYYLPRAAEFAEGLAEMRAQGRGASARAKEVEDILVKLEAAFAHYAAQLIDEDLRLLDTELKLVSEAIQEDLGDRAPSTRRETP